MNDKPNVIRPTDQEAIALARNLVRTARYGALAALDPASGAPIASRVGVATDLDGAPIILISGLAAHTQAIMADPRCSLLLGEVGKGDPLAHARISLSCEAEKLATESAEGRRARRRYLARNPKAKLYAELGDFSFFRLNLRSASLNGGFGRAYSLSAANILIDVPEWLDSAEEGAIGHMNSDHRDAVDLYAAFYAGQREKGWRITGIDGEGVDLVSGDLACRVMLPQKLVHAQDMRAQLVAMARDARKDTP